MNKLIVSTSAAASSTGEGEGGPEPTEKALKTTANYSGSVYGTYTSTWGIGASISPSLPNGNYSFDNTTDIETYRIASNVITMTGTAALSGGAITYYDDCGDYYTETDPLNVYGRIAGADTIYTTTVWGFLDERLDGSVELAPYTGVFDEGIQVGVFDRVCPSKGLLYSSCLDASLDIDFVQNAYFDGEWSPSTWYDEEMADGAQVQLFIEDGLTIEVDAGDYWIYDEDVSQTYIIEVDASGFLIAIDECIPPNVYDIYDTPRGMVLGEIGTEVYLTPDFPFEEGRTIYTDPGLTTPYDLSPNVYADDLRYPVSEEGLLGSPSPASFSYQPALLDGCEGDPGPDLYIIQAGSDPTIGDSVYTSIDYSIPGDWVEFDGLFAYNGFQYTVNTGVIGAATECTEGT